MNILIVYESIDGQTDKIAHRIADHIESANHQVILANQREPGAAIPGSQDACIICAPIHMGSFPKELVDFVSNFSDALNAMPSALVTVSLGAASEHAEERATVRARADDLVRLSGWTPTVQHDAAGALKYREYNFFKRLAMRYVATKSSNPVYSDHEFTDWDALATFTTDFLVKASVQSTHLTH